MIGETIPPPTREMGKPQEPWEKYRTCCDCCHIKVGTVFLGMIEAAACVATLYWLVQQVISKSATPGADHDCDAGFINHCLLWHFEYLNFILVLDLIVALMLVLILLSVLLMFCAIMSDTSSLLWPHLIVQLIFLAVSIGYFGVYGWTYFYGDIYLKKRTFTMQGFMERMWLAVVLLVIAAGQVYLFFTVAKCHHYLKRRHLSRRERETAFFRLTERVRIAKENGLWRTGGVAGFQTYTKQDEDQEKKKGKSKNKEAAHVQWSNENRVVVLTEEEDATRSDAPPSNSNSASTQPKPVATVAPTARSQQPRRRSSDSVGSGKDEGKAKFTRDDSGSSSRRSDGSSAGKQRGEGHVKITVDDESGGSYSPVRRRSSREEKLARASAAVLAAERQRKEAAREVKEKEKESRTSSSSSPEKEASKEKGGGKSKRAAGAAVGEGTSTGAKKEEHHHSHNVGQSLSDVGTNRSNRKLRKLKSMDSTELEMPPEVQERRLKSRRRSSDSSRHGQQPTDSPVVHHHRHHKEKRRDSKQQSQDTMNILKKVSISATVSPFSS